MMSELDPTTLRRELLLQGAIEQRLDALVSLATTAALRLSRNTQMEENQLRNLLNASLESKSVEVTTNFVRYQIARKERDWDTSLNGFGHTVIQHIAKNLKTMADDVLQAILRGLNDASQKQSATPDSDASTKADDTMQRTGIAADTAWFEAHLPHIHVRLMQLYLGYINRVFYFYKKSIDREKREPQSHALQDALTSLELVAKPPTEVKTDG
jgi:hypothetical protein